MITTCILLVGSVIVIYNSIESMFNPRLINYNGMIVFAIIGVAVNFCAAFFTREGDSLNQKAVNLHMLEDVFGWAIVLIGAIVMRFTDFALLDSLMSIGVALFILTHAIKNLEEVLDLFLEKIPHGIDMNAIIAHVTTLEGVMDVHHIHIWSMDGHHHYATMHVVTDADAHEIKEKIREELEEHGIGHVTLELEAQGEHCHEKECRTEHTAVCGHHHH